MNRNQLYNLFVKLCKSLAPGRAAGGNIELNSYIMFSICCMRK